VAQSFERLIEHDLAGLKFEQQIFESFPIHECPKCECFVTQSPSDRANLINLKKAVIAFRELA
jgi:hypothetical protein